MSTYIANRYELLSMLETMVQLKRDVMLHIQDDARYTEIQELVKHFNNSYADLTRLVALMPDYMVEYMLEDMQEAIRGDEMKIIVTTIIHNEVGIVAQYVELEGQPTTRYDEKYQTEDGYEVVVMEHEVGETKN